MQLALLGVDDAVIQLARCATDAGDVVVWVGGDEPPELFRLCPRARRGEAWEALLLGQIADLVVVGTGGAPDERAEWLRKLIGAAVPVLVAPGAITEMIVGYELEMIRRDVNGVVVPALPARTHPFVRRMAEWVSWTGADDGAPIGRPEQLIVQRSARGADRERVLADFARDVELLRVICGEVERLTATAPEDPSARWKNLVVLVEFSSGPAARWVLEELPPGERRITVRGSSGRVELKGQDGPAADGRDRFESLTIYRENKVDEDEGDRDQSLPGEPDGALEDAAREWSPGATSLDMFRRAAAAGAPIDPAGPTWTDYCRALELAEAIERSLRRRRTIDLPVEDYSVESSFKGAMSAVAFTVLLAAVAVVSIAALVELIPGMRWLSNLLYLALAVVCALILMAQLLRLVMPKAAK